MRSTSPIFSIKWFLYESTFRCYRLFMEKFGANFTNSFVLQREYNAFFL